jgi:hypothetical protein
MRLLHEKHFPICISQLRIGISSCHDNAFPHFGHFERPVMFDFPAVLRSACALIKLAATAPIIAGTMLIVMSVSCILTVFDPHFL